MTHVLKAVRFRHNVAYNEKGQPTEVHIYRAGDVVDDLPVEHLERLIAAGAVTIDDGEDVADDPDVPTEAVADDSPGDAETAASTVTERPRNTAAKKVWVDYAVTAKGWARDDAEALDRADLIEALG